MVKIFKRKPLEEIKQPQEYYCARNECTNEIAKFSVLKNLMTEEAYNMYASFYCLDCIIERKINE